MLAINQGGVDHTLDVHIEYGAIMYMLITMPEFRGGLTAETCPGMGCNDTFTMSEGCEEGNGSCFLGVMSIPVSVRNN
jgi:hypothetical protein